MLHHFFPKGLRFEKVLLVKLDLQIWLKFRRLLSILDKTTKALGRHKRWGRVRTRFQKPCCACELRLWIFQDDFVSSNYYGHPGQWLSLFRICFWIPDVSLCRRLFFNFCLALLLPLDFSRRLWARWRPNLSLSLTSKPSVANDLAHAGDCEIVFTATSTPKSEPGLYEGGSGDSITRNRCHLSLRRTSPASLWVPEA
jgi:hypothetical protein